VNATSFPTPLISDSQGNICRSTFSAQTHLGRDRLGVPGHGLSTGDTITISVGKGIRAVLLEEFSGLSAISSTDVNRERCATSTVLDSGTTATKTQPASSRLPRHLSTFGRTCTKDANYSTFTTVALGSTLELCAEYQLLSATGAQKRPARTAAPPSPTQASSRPTNDRPTPRQLARFHLIPDYARQDHVRGEPRPKIEGKGRVELAWKLPGR